MSERYWNWKAYLALATVCGCFVVATTGWIEVIALLATVWQALNTGVMMHGGIAKRIDTTAHVAGSDSPRATAEAIAERLRKQGAFACHGQRSSACVSMRSPD